MNVKAGRPLIDILGLCYRANRPVLIWGRHGIGKSEIIAQVAAELGIGFISRDLSLMEPPDLIGLPKIEGKSTVYLPPKFLPRTGRGILLFEELNRAERHMQAPCLQLLTARTLNDYRLPPGWLPVAAVNPATANYQVSELDPALRARFVQVHAVPDRREWLAWAQKNHIHPAVLEYVGSDPTIFDRPVSNPRAWRYVSEILHAAEEHENSPGTVRAAIAGLVGTRRADAFISMWKDDSNERPLAAMEVLTAYPRHEERLRRWVDSGRLDLLDTTLTNVLKSLQPESDFEEVRADCTQSENLVQFLDALPGDFRERAERFFTGRGYSLPGRRCTEWSS